jgi:hypothetical protein
MEGSNLNQRLAGQFSQPRSKEDGEITPDSNMDTDMCTNSLAGGSIGPSSGMAMQSGVNASGNAGAFRNIRTTMEPTLPNISSSAGPSGFGFNGMGTSASALNTEDPMTWLDDEQKACIRESYFRFPTH